MKENRLHEIFNKLSASELRQLAKYLRSPIFNQQESVVMLFDYMRKRKEKGWTDRKVFKHLYPKEKFDMQKLHYVHSFLLKQIESYLAWKEFTASDVDQYLYLMKAFRKKHLDKPFNRILHKTEKILDSNHLRNEAYHTYQYEIQKEIFYHQREKGRSVNFNLQELSDIQDISFIADKLKSACTMLSHQTMMKKEYDKGLLDEVLQRVNDNPKYLNYPAIGIYYFAFRALSDFNDEFSFSALKKLLSEKIHLFPPLEQRDIYILTSNYCIKKLNIGHKNFVREAFEIYKQGLSQNVFIENGILSRWTYNNIIILGLKLKEFDWVEVFIHDYKNSLDEKTREDSFNFNLAKFYFETSDYEKAMPLLVQTKYDDLLHNLGAKSTLAKMYYELSEWDALEHLLESFRVYILRKKDIGYHKEIYLNLIHFIKKIIHTNTFDKNELLELKKEITNTKLLAEREWILERVAALE